MRKRKQLLATPVPQPDYRRPSKPWSPTDQAVRDALDAFYRARCDPDALDELTLFGDAGLTSQERLILEAVVASTNVVRSSRPAELFGKLRRVGNVLVLLLSRGVPPTEVLEAADLPVEESELAAAEYFKGLCRRLARNRSDLRHAIRVVDRLISQAEDRLHVWNILQDELGRIESTHRVVEKVLEADASVLRQTKSPLLQRPPVNLVRLLVEHGLTNRESCQLTVAFLTHWAPTRFKGLKTDHVRRRCARVGVLSGGDRQTRQRQLRRR